MTTNFIYLDLINCKLEFCITYIILTKVFTPLPSHTYELE